MNNADGQKGLVLRIQHLTKHFGGVTALHDMGLNVRAGEIHGLLGHNGSGKSTLIKVLAGYHAPEPGCRIEIDGRTVQLPLRAGQFRSYGMAFVHQDPGLIPSLTVVENLRIGALARRRTPYISWRHETHRVARMLHEFGIDCDPTETVDSLEPWQRPLLGIIRAVDEMRTVMQEGENRHGLLVLDEPTANLGDAGIQKLFAIVRHVASKGFGVLFVSHDLDEVLAITDTVTVLRDGEVAGTGVTRNLTKDDLVEMILGKRMTPVKWTKPQHGAGETVASIDHLSGASVRGLDLAVARGEIIGLTGLVGSGFADVGAVLIGALAAKSGRLHIGSQEFDLRRMSPPQAIAAGMVYVPGERRREGCIGELTIAENVTLPVLRRFFHAGALQLTALNDYTRELCARFGVKPGEPMLPLEALSGGNQQKVLLAKWLQLQPKLLILQEPTQGVDVGAREQIFAIIRNYGTQGSGVLCASSDHEQLVTLCSRVLVFRRGRIVSDLHGTDVTKERISYECFGSEIALA
jgi:ribose transport system ATP-binding protein